MATVVSYTARPRRSLQALLLLFALVLGLGAFALQSLGRTGQLPDDMVPFAIGAVLCAVVLQVVVSIRAPFADPTILPLVVLLNLLGLTAIATYDSAKLAYQHVDQSYAERQMMWAVIGILLASAVIFFLHDHRVLRRYTWISAVLGGFLLILPAVPGIGMAVNGSQIWISVAGFSFQPAELAKICFAVFFAGYLVARRDTLALAGPKVLGIQLPRWSDFGPIIVAWAFGLAVLVWETDLGTSLLFFGLFVVMLYVATDRLSWLVIGAIMFAPPALLAITQVSRVRVRLTCWLDPLSTENFDRCGQINQGLFGMANGGMIGAGLGEGRVNLVPFGHSDFIYTTWSEEVGLVGACALLLLFLVLVQRALRTAVGISDGFGTLLAGGLAFTIALQVFVVVGGVTRVIPLTGLTLPFLAAGGSSLVCNWLIIGLLVRLSDAARRPAGRTNAAAAGSSPSPTPSEVSA